MAEEDSKLYHQDKYKELEDFKYYCKSESNFDYKQPFLLVDTSYLIFYRFFALRMWYSKAHKEKFAENTTQDEYELLAIELATEYKKLKIIKNKLNNNLSSSPLYDTPLYVKQIESAYLEMYDRYQKGLEPKHIYV